MTRFLRVAMTRGEVPVLICERSSRKVSYPVEDVFNAPVHVIEFKHTLG